MDVPTEQVPPADVARVGRDWRSGRYERCGEGKRAMGTLRTYAGSSTPSTAMILVLRQLVSPSSWVTCAFTEGDRIALTSIVCWASPMSR